MYAILLTARAGSGKDTLANIFERKDAAINLKIARPLKAACVEVLERTLGVSRESAERSVEIEKNEPIRPEKDARTPPPFSEFRQLIFLIFEARFSNVDRAQLYEAAGDVAEQLEPSLSSFPSLRICEHQLTGRRLAQNLGTILKARCGADFWVRRACDEIVRHASSSPSTARPIVLTDLRFPNEARALEETLRSLRIPSATVRIVRRTRGGAGTNACEATDVALHPSEIEMDSIPVHAELVNDAESPEDFQELAREFILDLLESKRAEACA